LFVCLLACKLVAFLIFYWEVVVVCLMVSRSVCYLTLLLVVLFVYVM
jgi:hypothetical protein